MTAQLQRGKANAPRGCYLRALLNWQPDNPAVSLGGARMDRTPSHTPGAIAYDQARHPA